MSDNASPRTVGFLFCLAGVFFLVGVVPALYRGDPFAGATLQHAQGTIRSVQPGRLSRFPRYYDGEFYQYTFTDHQGNPQQGHLFRRQFTGREYAIGQQIDVEYRQDQPSTHRLYGETSPHPIVMQCLAVLFFVGIVVGIIMMTTGRDFIADWKKR
ncbi:MAG: DUF3592 domain-containing protein [Gemmatales bacterium]